MFKKLLVNVLLKRGAGALEETIGKLIRHGMTAAGGYLAVNGVIDDPSVVQTITGSLITLGGLALSLVRIKLQKVLG